MKATQWKWREVSEKRKKKKKEEEGIKSKKLVSEADNNIYQLSAPLITYNNK